MSLARTSSPVLIGRDWELSAMLTAITRQSTVVMIEGEAGVGKTRLVRELLAHPRVARLRQLIGLGDLVPELVGSPPAERHRALRTTRELLAAAGPALLVVEDLHRADDGTRQLLSFLIGDPPPNLSIVVSYRPEDLAGSLGPGRPPDRVAGVSLRLEPLDVGEVRALAGAILDKEPVTAEFAARLHKRTAGIPFLVEEVLRSGRGSLDDVAVPAVLRNAMAGRLAGLPEPARRLVRAAAVLGVPARLGQLVAVAGIEAGDGQLALSQAVGGGALVDTAPARYGFRHDLARQAVYDTLGGPERRQLHVAAIEAVRHLDPPPLVELAEHSRLAGRTADWLRYGEQAADRAAEVGDPSVATGLLQRLLAEPGLSGPDVSRLAVKLGSVAYSGLDQHEPVATLRRLLHDRRLGPAARGEVRLFLGLLLVRQASSIEAGRTQIRRAITELAGRQDLAAKGAALLGLPFIGGAPATEQREWRAVAERQLRETDDAEVRISLLTNVLGARLLDGDPTVLTELDRLPQSVERAGERRQLARAHGNLADACTAVGHFRAARALLSTALRLAASAGSPFVVGITRSTQVHLDWYTGEWDGLADRATRLLADYRDLLPVTSELALVLGLLATSRGEWAAARSHFTLTGVAEPNDAIIPVLIGGYAGLARMWRSRDEVARAELEVNRGLKALRRKGVWPWAADLVPVAVSTLLATGKPAETRALVEEVSNEVAGRDAPLVHAALKVGRGELAEHAGDLAAAIEHYRAGQSAYEALPAPYLAALAAERAARCGLSTGDAAATEELATLADDHDRRGATHDAARCRHELRSHGGTTPSRRGRRGYGDRLSPREEDVARLLSQGLTNREIADVLFLSPRTVEQHVANLLRKLGLKSRTELTRTH